MGNLDAPPDDGDAVTAGVPAPSEVVRCARLEVVDGDGAVRLVAGDLSPTAGFGIALLDRDGARRVVVALDRDGPVVVLDQHGTIAVEIGVHDDPGGDAEAPPAGAYAMLNDGRGRPVAGIRVDPDGRLTLVGDLATGPDERGGR